jgi:flagellin
MILRMRELAVQMENGIYTSKDRDNAQLEVNALLQEIDKIASNTRFNDVKLLDGAYDQTIRAGNTNAETIRVSIDALSTASTAKLANYADELAVGGAVAYTAGTGAVSNNNVSTIAATATVGDTTTVNIGSNAHSTFKEVFKGDSLGTFAKILVGADGTNSAQETSFSIDAKTGQLTSTSKLAAGTYKVALTYSTRDTTDRDEEIRLTLVISAPSAGSTLAGIEVETSVSATHAIETLDKALEEVSSAQAKLGAIQNRLQHNIDNLSKSAMLTEQSVGRVTDADFATETSNLSKQQILNQAATAMLAQANQSKQSVLSLLQ